jgi:hypothetical protein
LVDGSDNMIDYLIFPVLPDSISRNHQDLLNIKKTQKGITTYHTTTFVPFDISISGTFGRALKIIIGTQELNIAGMRYSAKSNVFTKQDVLSKTRIKSGLLNSEVKTGYGLTKLLQSMIEKSSTLDDQGKPMRLHFYNNTFGESNVVKIQSFDVQQNKDQFNALWQYNVKMKAIAPLNAMVNTKQNTATNTSFSIIQKSVNEIARFAKSLI